MNQYILEKTFAKPKIISKTEMNFSLDFTKLENVASDVKFILKIFSYFL